MPYNSINIQQKGYTFDIFEIHASRPFEWYSHVDLVIILNPIPLNIWAPVNYPPLFVFDGDKKASTP